jgi:GT2 family glycosyltransferase
MIEQYIPRVGIIVVNLNDYEDTAQCLRSLESITYPNVELIVVDNGSRDGSGQRLKREFRQVTYIDLETNLGSTGGRNAGITHTLEVGCDYALLLDDDAIVTTTFLEPLLTRMETSPKIAAVTGKIYNAPQTRSGKSNILWYAGCHRKWHTWFNHRGMDEKDTGQYDRATTVASMPACLMLMRGSAIRTIGLLSDDYFVYWEEADWCFRAKRAGYECYYEPKSVIVHNYKSGEGGKETPFYNYLQYRNALIFNSKHNSPLKQLQFWITLPILLLHRIVRDVRAKNFNGVRAIGWGVRDFFRGYKGKKGLLDRGLLKY